MFLLRLLLFVQLLSFPAVLARYYRPWYNYHGIPRRSSDQSQLRNTRQRSTGVVFQRPMYTFVVVDPHTTGVIGRIQATSGGTQNVKYQLLSKHPDISVDSNSGKIRLQRRRTSSQKKTVRITILRANASAEQCRCSRGRSTTSIRIVSLPAFYGDNILRAVRHNMSVISIQENHLSRDATPENLHRVVRKISSKTNQFATEMASAQATKDTAYSSASFAIKRFFARLYPSVTISASLKHLLSPSTMKNVLKRSECPRRKIVYSFCRRDAKYRSIDGTCNNMRSPLYGASSSAFKRLLPAKYYDPDGLKDPLGSPDATNSPDLPNPLQIAKEFLIIQKTPSPVKKLTSHFLTQWGQFLDHDFTLAPESEGADQCRRAPCRGSLNDYRPPCFTILPYQSSRCIHFTRSAAVCRSNPTRETTREQMNANTAFIDGSQIYGSTLELLNNLRDFAPNRGLLRVRHLPHGDLMPFDSSELMFPNHLCRETGGCFLAGDVRSSEQMALAAIHTLFLREHNRIAEKLLKINPHWSGNKTFEETRKIVGAILQKVTYEDFLPTLLGPRPLPRYTGYRYWVDPGVINSVAAAAFRYGHSSIRPFFEILDENHNPVGAPIPLKHMFFNNTFINRHGIKYLLFGACAYESQAIDREVASGIVNHLFERPRSRGLNLVALNIQRGRDHGLPGYNDFRRLCHLSDARSFDDTAEEITSKPTRDILAKLYNDDPSVADLWVAGIAETPIPGTDLGPTFACLIKKQFTNLRDGDRFFYRKGGVFSLAQLKEIRKASVSRLFCDNIKTSRGFRVQKNIFWMANDRNPRTLCKDIPEIDLEKWRDIAH